MNLQIHKLSQRVFISFAQKIGKNGLYQKLTALFSCTIGYLCGGIALMTPYLFYQDPYVCYDNYAQGCHNYVCSLQPAERLRFISTPSMITLGNQYGDYRCEKDKINLDLISSLFYFGGVAGCLFLALLGNFMGRKKLLIFLMGILIFGLGVACISKNLLTAGIGLFLICMGVQSAYTLSFLFLAQTISQQYRQKYLVATEFFYGFGVVSNVAYYYFIGNWTIILWIFYFIPFLIVFIIILFYIADAPMFLITNLTPENALAEFTRIGKINGISVSITINQLKQIKQKYEIELMQQNQSNFTILDLLKYPSQRMKTLFLMLMTTFIVFQYYIPYLMIDEFQLNIFVNGIVMSLSEMCSYVMSYLMIRITPRKSMGYFGFTVVFVCSIILNFTWKVNEDRSSIMQNISVLILVCILRFFASMEYTFFMVYINQLYATQVRIIGYSLIEVLSSLGTTLNPILVGFCRNYDLSIMIFLAIVSLFSLFCQYQLPQTLNHPPVDLIEQFLQNQSKIFDQNILNDQMQSKNNKNQIN